MLYIFILLMSLIIKFKRTFNLKELTLKESINFRESFLFNNYITLYIMHNKNTSFQAIKEFFSLLLYINVIIKYNNIIYKSFYIFINSKLKYTLSKINI